MIRRRPTRYLCIALVGLGLSGCASVSSTSSTSASVEGYPPRYNEKYLDPDFPETARFIRNLFTFESTRSEGPPPFWAFARGTPAPPKRPPTSETSLLATVSANEPGGDRFPELSLPPLSAKPVGPVLTIRRWHWVGLPEAPLATSSAVASVVPLTEAESRPPEPASSPAATFGLPRRSDSSD